MFIVTGASSGIGRAAALALANSGRNLIAVGQDVNRLSLLQEACPEFIQVLAADLSSESGLSSVARALENVALIQGVVHAAGSAVPLASYQQLASKDLTHHFLVHVATPIALNNLLLEKLKGARIVYLDSYSASSPRVGWAAYSIVKSAAQMAARLAARELSNTAVIRVFPGGVRTPLVQAVLDSTDDNDTVKTFKETELAGNMSEPDVIGKYISDILLNATEDQIESREVWDFGDTNDRVFD